MLKKEAFFCCFIWVAVPVSAFSWVEICQGKLALAKLPLFARTLRLTVTIRVPSAHSAVRPGQVAETTKAKVAQLHGTARSVLLTADVLRAWAHTQTLVFVAFNHIRAFTITLLGPRVLPLRVFLCREQHLHFLFFIRYNTKDSIVYLPDLTERCHSK